ncbi:tRNA 2'-phosphotransferase [Tilletia horrida]|nr:tRNA 2'-phosphotransferase [Tilletia horrida]
MSTSIPPVDKLSLGGEPNGAGAGAASERTKTNTNTGSQRGGRGRGSHTRGGGRGGRGGGRGGPAGGRRFPNPNLDPAQEADVALSKTLSYLLRHGAQAESLAITPSGWIGVRELLARPKVGKLRFPSAEGEGEAEAEAEGWRTGAGVKDVRRVVKDSDKKRFQLGWARAPAAASSTDGAAPALAPAQVGVEANDVAELEVEGEEGSAGGEVDEEALERADGKVLFIRAVQGHSISSVRPPSSVSPLKTARQADSTLTICIHTPQVSSDILFPITASNLHLLHPSQPLPSTDPKASPAPAPANFDPATLTVVHGTTLAGWERISVSRGLNRMGRNHIHLARGLPREMLSALPQNAEAKENEEGKEEEAPTIISGLRPTATVLLWVDVPRALQNGVEFFLSENGVVLTPGRTMGSDSGDAAAEDKKEATTGAGAKGPQQQQRRGKTVVGPAQDGWLSLDFITHVQVRRLKKTQAQAQGQENGTEGVDAEKKQEEGETQQDGTPAWRRGGSAGVGAGSAGAEYEWETVWTRSA